MRNSKIQFIIGHPNIYIDIETIPPQELSPILVDKLKSKLIADYPQDFIDLLRLKQSLRVFCLSKTNLSAIKIFVRKILDRIESLKLPSEWEQREAMYMGEADVQVFVVPKGSEEYRRIETPFMKTMKGKKIVKVERIQNRRLWKVKGYHAQVSIGGVEPRSRSHLCPVKLYYQHGGAPLEALLFLVSLQGIEIHDLWRTKPMDLASLPLDEDLAPQFKWSLYLQMVFNGRDTCRDRTPELKWRKLFSFGPKGVPLIHKFIPSPRVMMHHILALYKNEKEEITKNMLGPSFQPQLSLYHGTSTTPPDMIYKSDEGFDMRFSNAGMWGKANYFAMNASYSDAYSYRVPSKTKYICPIRLFGMTGIFYI